MTTFTDAAWESPESELNADQFCECCLIDQNPSGQQKTKDNCHLPIRSKPGGPVNKNALQSASGALMGARGGLKGVSGADRRKAAKTIVSYERQAKMEPSDSLLKLAGEK